MLVTESLVRSADEDYEIAAAAAKSNRNRAFGSTHDVPLRIESSHAPQFTQFHSQIKDKGNHQSGHVLRQAHAVLSPCALFLRRHGQQHDHETPCKATPNLPSTFVQHDQAETNHHIVISKQLMNMLRLKVIDIDRENHLGLLEKSIKLLIEMFESASNLLESSARVLDERQAKQFEDLKVLIDQHLSTNSNLNDYASVIKIYYMDSTKQSKEIVNRTKAVLAKDRVMAYFLTFVTLYFSISASKKNSLSL